MKRPLLFALSLLLAVTTAFAERVSQDDAALVATNFMNAGSTATRSGAKAASPKKMVLKKAATATSENQYYVYENASGEGWVMVSASDVAHPILAYSETGEFVMENQPVNIKYWLARYEKQIRNAEANNVSASSDVQAEWKSMREGTIRKGTVDPVSPLMTTQWNQGAPYNCKCPQADGMTAYTGCVATATAQIMYYHKWPTTGQGSRTYNWTSDAGDSGTSTADFGSTTYDWANMKNKHNTSDTQAQKNAIGTLMFHVGVACKMQYGGDASNGSGAYTSDMVSGLKSYFRYKSSAKIRYVDSDGTSTAANNIIAEVRAGRPVLMGGATKNNEGHEFVCDGVDSDGYLHINWGWGGSSDGYFALAALDPDQQGAGGAASGQGFSKSVEYVTGLEPDTNPVSVTGITVSPTSQTIKIKERLALTATITPSNASNKGVVWSTSNASVATVSASGVVVGVTQGSATITAKTNDGNKTASCNITVTDEVALPTVLNVDAASAWYDSQYEDPWTIAVYNTQTTGNIPYVSFYPANTSTNKIAGTYTLGSNSGALYNDPEDPDNSYVVITSGQLIVSCTGNGSKSGCKKYRILSQFTCEDGAEYKVDLTTEICATDANDNSISLADNTGDGAVYEITWKALGQLFTSNYAVDGKLALPTDKPANCSNGKAFVGWTLATSVSGDVAPTLAKNGDAVSANATYNAVYATGSAGGEGSATYTFTSKAWAATEGNWTSGQAGAGYSNNGVQVTANATGANATAPESYSGVTSIVVSYCTNASKGAGTIVLNVDGTEVSQSVTSSGGTTPRDLTFDFSSSKPTGAPKITVNCTTNSIYICAVTINYKSVTYSDYSLDCSQAPEPESVTLTPTVAEAYLYPDESTTGHNKWKIKIADGPISGTHSFQMDIVFYTSSANAIAGTYNSGLAGELEYNSSHISATAITMTLTVASGASSHRDLKKSSTTYQYDMVINFTGNDGKLYKINKRVSLTATNASTDEDPLDPGDPQAETCTITWMVCGNQYGVQTVSKSSALVLPAEPEAKEGRQFYGWTTNPNYNSKNAPTKVEAGTIVDADVTYYAVFK